MLKHRVITAVLLGPLLIWAVLKLPHDWFAALLGLVFAYGGWEWTRLAGVINFAARLVLVVILGIVLGAIWLFQSASVFNALVVIGVGWWALALMWLKRFQFGSTSNARSQLIKLLAGIFTIAPAFAAAMALRQNNVNGPAVVLFVMVLIWVADTCAYFAGKNFGKTKLAPRISPGKTTQGLYGALIGSAIFALIAGWQWQLIAMGLVGFIVLSLATVLISVVGDLFESLMKRHANLKDSGNLLPGHGGILDRFDSLFAALPIFALGQWLFGS